jgi:hypothetical protein
VDEGQGPAYGSPQVAAEAFAIEVLGWKAGDTQAEVISQAPIRVDIWNQAVAALAETSNEFRTTLSMERWRGREDGILVVTRADANALEITTPAPGQEFGPGLAWNGTVRFGAPHLLITLSIGEHAFRFGEPVFRPGQGGGWEADAVEDVSTHFHFKYPEDWVTSSYPLAVVFLSNNRQFPLAETPAHFREQGMSRFLTLSAFRLGPYQAAPESSDSPVPGPTPTSDDATPAPIRIVVDDRTGAQNAFPYVFGWIESRGPGTHHGGYDLGDADANRDDVEGNAVAPTLTADPIPITRIYYEPGQKTEADRIQQLLFPGAEIGPPPTDEEVNVAYADQQPLLRVELGEDFVERHAELIRAFNFLWDFGFMREAGSPNAESFVTEEIARKYEEDRYLSMYEYAEGRSSEVGFTGVPEDGLSNVDFFLNFSDGCKFNTERLRVDHVGSALKVVQATLSSGGSC